MPFVLKDNSGKVVATSLIEQQGEGWQKIEAHDADYILFLEETLRASEPFRESDISLARVLEDLITLLIERDVIRFTDFPRAAQKRLNERQELRHSNRLHGLLDDSKDIAY